MTGPLLVYGVVRSSHRDLDALSTGEGVDVVRGGTLAAIVRAVPEDAVLEDDDASDYLDTLIGLLPGGPVVPVRFGTVAPSEDAVHEEILDAGAEALSRCLDALEGHLELRVAVAIDEQIEIPKLSAGWPEMMRSVRAERHDGSLEFRVELGRQVSVRLAERRDRLSDALLARLRPLTVAYACLESYAPTELRHAYLVRADRLGDIDAAVRAFGDELGGGYAIEYVGPLPAFDFTDLQIDPGARGSAWGWSGASWVEGRKTSR